MSKLKVGVLMGGASIEAEVSFNSGRTVCDHLDAGRYEVIPLFQTTSGTIYLLPWHFLHRGKITDFVHRLSSEAEKLSLSELKKRIDFLYIALHGRYGEDGCIQGMCEILNIPYLGSKVFASALRSDKIIQKEFLKIVGIKTPPGTYVDAHELHTITHAQVLDRLSQQNVTFPLIIKPHAEGSSLGVSVVFKEAELMDAVHQAGHIFEGKSQSVVVEQKIEGMEFSCIILYDYTTGKPILLPPTEIEIEKNSHFFDYTQKYMPGRATKHTPARISQENIEKIQNTCLAVMNALEFCTMARIDGILTTSGDVYIFDPNTLSGMGPASFLFKQAAHHGMSHAMLINHLIETELHAEGILQKILKEEHKEQRKQAMKKLRVAVLLGGASQEKEISLESGRNITFKLSPLKYDVTPIFVSSQEELYPLDHKTLVYNTTQEIEASLKNTTPLSWDNLHIYADFVFIALHGGSGENGSVQGMLEMLGLPYNGSGVLTSALCMDKYKTTQFLKHQGFDVPQSLLIDHHDWQEVQDGILKTILQSLTYPLIVKPHDDGCSVFVEKVHSDAELVKAMHQIFAFGKEKALVEEYIVGMELTGGVIGNIDITALPPSQAIAIGGILSIEEKFLPGAGENQTPAPLSQDALQRVQRTLENVYRALNCKGYVRIDCFYQTAKQSPTGSERVVILEVNTLPGMTPATCIFHQAAEIGIKPMEFIDMIVQFGLEQHRAVGQTDIQLKTKNESTTNA